MRFLPRPALADKYMRQYVRKTVPGAAAAMMLGADAFRRVQEKTAEVLKEELPNMLPASYDYMEDAMEAEATLRESLEVR